MFCCNPARALGLLALMVLALPTSAQTVLTPTDDAYVQSNNEDEAKGTTDPNRLWIRTASSLTRHTYLKFDLSGLSGSVQNAILRVTVDVAPATAEVDRMDAVGAASDNWLESTITFNNAPAVGDPSVFVASNTVARQTSTDPDQTYEFDVTDLVAPEASGDGVVTIVLIDLTETQDVDIRIHSKESSGTSPQLVVMTGGVANESDAPDQGFRVAGGVPNPFSARTTVSYELPTAGHLTVEAYNVLGQRVATLRDGAAAAGANVIVWDASGTNGAQLASGVYAVRFAFEGQVRTQAVTITR